MTEDISYQKVISSLKKRRKGATTADICADTALPLEQVKLLLPKAADEFKGQLQVTQSGEILYAFPDGFTSRYRGFSVKFLKAARLFTNAVKKISVFLFKVWIAVMLIGYFILFIAIALASVVLSIAAQNSSNNNRRGGVFSVNLFSIIWRIWFVNEITRPRYGNYRHTAQTRKKDAAGLPMHKAVFSFVFGEEDPNKGWDEQEDKAVISYIQSNRGVISLTEYMAFTGKNSVESQEELLAFCSRFGGSPEVTEEGVIVYRFDELLLRADNRKFTELSPPIKRLKTFSANPKKKNGWFILINAVNLIFGSYFLFHAVNSGLLVSQGIYEGVSRLFAITHILFAAVSSDPLYLITLVLGVIPFVFSILFWLIPAFRYFTEKKENENIKLENFKRLGFAKILKSPVNVEADSLASPITECRPKDMAAAADRVIKELGTSSGVDVETGENGKMLYSFNELKMEKDALNKYRSGMDAQQAKLGDVVFDTGEVVN